MDLGLDGRRALITGSHRGTGAGIARVLATEGVEVLVHGFERGQADEVAAAIVADGGRAAAVTGDLASDAGAAQLADAVGSVDVLINNYGAPMGSRWDSTETWAEEWNVNMLTGVRMAQALAPAMRQQGWGRIVFLGTVGSRIPGRRNPGYYGAKAALHAVVRSLAQELRGSGVTCNLVSPGMIATTEVRASMLRRAAAVGEGESWESAQRWALRTTMPNLTERVPDPDDIGGIVAFVASEAAWHINGADIAVDGGAVDARG
jgi:NAD(P)-dependent dehydrogenase (short-subunit alcohol dehydrogenase family)